MTDIMTTLSLESPLLAVCYEIISTMKQGLNGSIYDIELKQTLAVRPYNKVRNVLVLSHNDQIISRPYNERILLELWEDNGIILINAKMLTRIELARPDSLEQFTTYIGDFTINYMDELACLADAMLEPRPFGRKHYAKMWREMIETYKQL